MELQIVNTVVTIIRMHVFVGKVNMLQTGKRHWLLRKNLSL